MHVSAQRNLTLRSTAARSRALGLRLPTSWRLAWMLAWLGALSGCTSLPEYVHNHFKVGPNYDRPAAPTAAEWIDAGDARVKSDPPADCAWWTVLNDPTLDGLIASAYRQNLDLRTAGARIIEARSQRAIAIGNLFPQTQTMDVNVLQSTISQNLPIPFPQTFDLWTAGFNGSWELDIWGRYRRAVESADARLDVSVETYGEVLVLMLSDVAQRYIELRTFQQRLAYAVQNVEIQRGSLKLAEARIKQGVASELDMRQARANLWQTEALIPIYEAGIRQSANALCVLLAAPPTDLAATLAPAPIPTAPPTISLGMPADLLARRPDVRRAEREVAAQSAQIGIAVAALYPSLTLNGYVGFWAEDANELFNGSSFTGSFIPRFSWNVLNYGRIANNIIAQDARLEAAALQYQQTVLKAGQEVENSLVRFLQAQRQARFLQRSVDDAKRAVELVEIQFQAGATDFNRVYTLQAFLTSQQDQLAIAEGNIALNLVGVYKGLGGGWRCFLKCPGLPAPCPRPEDGAVASPPAELLPPPPAVLPPGAGPTTQIPTTGIPETNPPAGVLPSSSTRPKPPGELPAQLPAPTLPSNERKPAVHVAVPLTRPIDLRPNMPPPAHSAPAHSVAPIASMLPATGGPQASAASHMADTPRSIGAQNVTGNMTGNGGTPAILPRVALQPSPQALPEARMQPIARPQGLQPVPAPRERMSAQMPVISLQPQPRVAPPAPGLLPPDATNRTPENGARSNTAPGNVTPESATPSAPRMPGVLRTPADQSLRQSLAGKPGPGVVRATYLAPAASRSGN